MIQMDPRHYELAAAIEVAAREYGTVYIGDDRAVCRTGYFVGAATVVSAREWKFTGPDAAEMARSVRTFFHRTPTWMADGEGHFDWVDRLQASLGCRVER
jgi:hypothetical protein